MIKLPVGVFSKGTVIDIEFRFDDDKNKSKRRPAIVIDYDENVTRVVVLKVTTKGVRSFFDYPLSDANMAGLKKESVVRCNHIMTVSNNLKCNMVGNLSRKDLLAVELLYNTAVKENTIVQ